MDRPSKVYVLVLNWNGWGDTIACLESVLRSDYPDLQIILCDNDSGDGSLDRIRAWAEGGELPAEPTSERLRHLTTPPVKKPVAYVEYDRPTAEAGGDERVDHVPLVIIRTGGNLGFAGGNNVGLRLALARDDFDYVWVLNNDTVVLPDALTHLVRRMQESPTAGMCGSTIPYYDDPDKAWALGGAQYNPWFAEPRTLGLRTEWKRPLDVADLESKMKYIAGASMLVSRSFLVDIGLMCEDYFLYNEELDWALRGKHKYTLAYAPESIVYHKVGASTGTVRKKKGGNSQLEWLILRNKVLLTYRFFPAALPLVLSRVSVAWMGNHVKWTLQSCARTLHSFRSAFRPTTEKSGSTTPSNPR